VGKWHWSKLPDTCQAMRCFTRRISFRGYAPLFPPPPPNTERFPTSSIAVVLALRLMGWLRLSRDRRHLVEYCLRKPLKMRQEIWARRAVRVFGGGVKGGLKGGGEAVSELRPKACTSTTTSCS